jgi:hypothetical protein
MKSVSSNQSMKPTALDRVDASNLATDPPVAYTKRPMRAKILFKSLLQDSQDYATFEHDDAHVVSVIHFDMEVGDRKFHDLSVEVRQPYGTDFETEPLEVSRISGHYRGPWNHAAFGDLCEAYYRSLIGSTGTVIRIGGASNIRMRNNFFGTPREAQLDIPDESCGAW